MRIAIMQPYIFPYIGYFHLVHAADKFIFYDDVNYIKKGWINRNRILLNFKDHLFTVPCRKVSQNKLINEIEIDWNGFSLENFFKMLDSAYSKAPFYLETKELIHQIFYTKPVLIAELAERSVRFIAEYLDMKTTFLICSKMNYGNRSLTKADRLIDIALKEKGSAYINALNGQSLYSKEYFLGKGIKLFFVQSKDFQYSQNSNSYIPNLSILDILMFNSKSLVKNEFLTKYTLI